MLNAGPVHLLYFYALMLINLGILASQGALWLPNRLLAFLGYLFLSGMAGFMLGSESIPGFLKAFTGIVPSALYFAAFFRYMRFNVKLCFVLYARMAFYVAAFGIVFLPFQPYGGGRLMSICQEPSMFCVVCVPAAFYYLDQLQREHRGALRLTTLLIAIALTLSSLGVLGMLFGFYLFGRRYRYGKVLAPAVVVLLGMLMYNYSELFRVRMYDAVVGTSSNDVSEANISTFGLLANFYVTKETFTHNPLLGGGLGSYVTSHQRYLENIPGIALVLDEDRLNLGQWDASSLLFRITAELGLLGFCAAIWFLVQYWPRGGSAQERAIAMSVLCYVLMKFLRDGTYFNPEVFFFLGAYAVLGAMAKARNTALPNTRPVLPATSGVVLKGEIA